MSDKQYYIVYVTTKHGMERYLIEHYIMPEFESLAAYNKWRNMIQAYFRERTAIKGGQIAAIEPSEVISVYPFMKDGDYER